MASHIYHFKNSKYTKKTHGYCEFCIMKVDLKVFLSVLKCLYQTLEIVYGSITFYLYQGRVKNFGFVLYN